MATSSDIAQSDLAELLNVLGMGDHARPQSPHEVFQEALGVLRQRLEATGRRIGAGAVSTVHLKPCPWEEPHLCCYPDCNCAADRESEDDREINRILAMSGDELRAELVAEGHDPDALVRQMKQGLDGTLRLAADRQRWREEAASWRRVAERLEAQMQALRAKADDQMAYWRKRMAAEKTWEDGISEDGLTYTPIGDEAAWSGGYCNGRLGEAEWWQSTLKYMVPASGIEARSDAMRSSAAEGESPVGGNAGTPRPLLDPLAGITTDPVLLEALKRAIAHKMTPAEKHAQRRSWIIGEMGIEHPEMSRKELEALADHAVGPAPAAETSPPEAPTSRVGEA